MKKVKSPDVVQPRLLTIKQAAAYLASTEWYVRTLVWERKVTFLRMGKRIVFDRADLDRYVDEMKKAA